MALTPEGRVKKALSDRLKAEGWPYNTVTTHGRGRSGHPDFTVNAAGHYVLVETKIDKPVPTALQDNELARHAKAGALGFVLARTGLRVYTPAMPTGSLILSAEDLTEALNMMIALIKNHF